MAALPLPHKTFPLLQPSNRISRTESQDGQSHSTVSMVMGLGLYPGEVNPLRIMISVLKMKEEYIYIFKQNDQNNMFML